MFIASSYMLYSPSPSGLTGSSGAAPVPAAASGYAAASGHFPVSAFATPALSPLIYRRAGDDPRSPDVPAAVKKPGGGFSVSDILDHRRNDHSDAAVHQLPKTAACVVVSRRSPSCASSDTRSLSPATPPPHDLRLPMTGGRPASVSPPRFSRLQLKFGMDRILAEDSSEPTERYAGSYADCAPRPSPSPPQASSSFTCCSVSPAPRVHRLPAPVHATSGGCECALPFCDGRGNVFHPLYAAYPAAALTHALGYPACTIYPTSPHMNADLEPLLRPHHHHHLHHQSIGSTVNGSAASSGGNGHHHALTASSGKRKRSWSRAVFSNLQRKGLEKRFQIQKYITKPDRRQLAATLGLTDAQVKVWFQNRRMKWRHSKEAKEELNKQTTNKTDAKTTDLKTNVLNNNNNNNNVLKNSEASALNCNLKPNAENTSEKSSESKSAAAPPTATTAPLAVVTGTKRPLEASLREF